MLSAALITDCDTASPPKSWRRSALAQAGNASPLGPNIYCGRRKAPCDKPYCRRPTGRNVDYACVHLYPNVAKAHWVVQPATASLGRTRHANR